MVELSVVIPVYNGASCLGELYRRLVQSLELLTPCFEIVFIEDRGGDDSWERIQELSQRDLRVRGFQLSRNFGQHPAITAGLDVAKGRWVVVMDCDLQDRPEEIPRLYRKAMEGWDVVVARRGRRKDSLWKRSASRVFYACFSWLSGLPMDPEVGNFRIISRKVVENLRRMKETTRFFVGMVEWMGFPTGTIPVQHDMRQGGKTNYTIRKLFSLGMEVIVAYSDKPLWMSVRVGFMISLGAVLGGAYVIYRSVCYKIPILGWASLIVSIYFLGGVIISLLGILGVYLAKVFDGVKDRPLYIIDHRTDPPLSVPINE